MNCLTYEMDVEGIRVRVTHKNVKNYNFRVSPEGQISMSVPYHVSDREVLGVALRHLDWMRTAIEKVRSAPSQTVSWQTGGTIRIWGEERTLRLMDSDVYLVQESEDELLVMVPEGSEARVYAAVVEEYLAGELRQYVESILPRCAKEVGCAPTEVKLRRMKSRWGSCTTQKRTIRLNLALAECPRPCTDMVLTHELCHIIEAHHSPRFYALMDLHMPDWRVWDSYLNEHPPRPTFV